MRRWLLAAGVLATLAAGVIVAASSSAGGGNTGPFKFYSGVFVTDGSSISSLHVTNLSTSEQEVKVTFRGEAGTDSETLTVGPGEQTDSASSSCPTTNCVNRVEARSKSSLVALTLRYEDTNDALHEVHTGDFVVVRDGKRVW